MAWEHLGHDIDLPRFETPAAPCFRNAPAVLLPSLLSLSFGQEDGQQDQGTQRKASEDEEADCDPGEGEEGGEGDG